MPRPRQSRIARLLAALAVACALSAGCDSGGAFPDAAGSAPARPGSVGSRGRHLDFSARGGALPSVFVEKAPEKRWTYTYHIQGEAFREADFLGLCRSIARDAPDMVVSIVPATAMSEDEIGLVRARIRENGLSNVRVLSSYGTVRQP